MECCLLLFTECILPGLKKLGGVFLCCLWEKVGYMYNFKENLDSLEKDLGELIAKRDTVLLRVNAGVLKGGQVLPTVDRWLSQVETIERNINKLLVDASTHGASSQDASIHGASSQDASTQDASTQGASSQDASTLDASSQDASTSGCWPLNCNLGKEVSKKLNEVRNLSLREFDVVTQQAPPPVVEVRPYQQTFGLTTTLEKTWKSLMDDDTRMLGIYGMGGIGKTTLLTLINNRFVDFKDDFDVVIWVKVSKDADIGKIQDGIGKRLGLYDENWCTYSETEKACEISRVLTNVKPRFVLLLDDLWKKVSLTTIGIPLQGRRYKVVLATRFQDVCGSMGAKEDIEVQFLAENYAWDLFKQKARCGRLNDQTSDVAKRVAAKCYGLPLALEVIGKILASKTTIGNWRRALSKLESTPIELKGTEADIFSVLKLSYDNLEDDDVKLCFQYCALFPKAYNIKREELVDYWIGEGIIDQGQRRQRAKDRGDDIIETLVEAGLLLKDGESEQKVYMHDMIREMALWIVSTLEDGERYVVQAGAGLSQLPFVTDWTTVTKMSLMNNQIKSIPDNLESPDLARLITLFLQNNKLEKIVVKFFMDMSTLLVVLDLSQNLGITELPEDISNLVFLRYLSLLRTGIKVLPSGFEKLGRLIHLDLESTPSLQNISLISGLSNLQVLRFYDSAALDLSLLKKLERFKGLERLTITVRKDDVLTSFLTSNLAGRTQGLYLEGLDKVSGVSEKSFAATFGGMLVSLCKLEMTECNIIETEMEWQDNIQHHQYSPSTSSNQVTPSNTWFTNLSSVVISSCGHLKDLTWLIYAANLESLRIELSPKIEEVISETKARDVGVDDPFQKLQVLDLSYLNELKSIYWTPLSFPKLQKVDIKKCPKLCRLPLSSTSVERIDDLLIEVEEEWLKEVKWESGAQERFNSVIRRVSVSQHHQV